MDPEVCKKRCDAEIDGDLRGSPDALDLLDEFTAETAGSPESEKVYYIRFCCRVNIGFTTNLPERLKIIPHHEVLATEPGGQDVERSRHDEFESLRDVGEWFDYGPELRAHVLRLQGKAPMLVDTEAAALYAGLTIETIYRWGQEGRLTRYGGRGRGGARWDVRQIPQWDGPDSGKPRPRPPKVIAQNFQDRG